jgi:hypothetical protein
MHAQLNDLKRSSGKDLLIPQSAALFPPGFRGYYDVQQQRQQQQLLSPGTLQGVPASVEGQCACEHSYELDT